jgi:hypothetical protein
MISAMSETLGGDFAARLQLVAVGFVLPAGLGVEAAVVLAEDLLASGFTGPATIRVASLQRGAIRSEAEQPIREMLAEHGIGVHVPEDEDDKYRLLLTAFGNWRLPLHSFEGPFYARIPAWDDQGPLDRSLVMLLDRRDNNTRHDGQRSIEDEVRAVVRAHVPAE